MLRRLLLALLPRHASSTALPLALALHGTGHSQKTTLCRSLFLYRFSSIGLSNAGDGDRGESRSSDRFGPSLSPEMESLVAEERSDNDDVDEEDDDDDDELWFRGEDSDSWECLNDRLDLGFLEEEEDVEEEEVDGGDGKWADDKESANGAFCGFGEIQRGGNSVEGGFSGLGMHDSVDLHNVEDDPEVGFLGSGKDNSAMSCYYRKEDVKGKFSGFGTDNSFKFRYAKDDVKGGFSGIRIDNSVKFHKAEDDVEVGLSGLGIDDSAKFHYFTKDDANGRFSGSGANYSVKSCHRYAKDDDKGTFLGLGIDNSSKFGYVSDNARGRFSGLGIDNSAKFHNAEVGFSGSGIDNSSKFGYYAKDNVKGGFRGFGASSSVKSHHYAKDDDNGNFTGLGRVDSVKGCYSKENVKGRFSGFGADNSVKSHRYAKDDDKGAFSDLGTDDSVKLRYAKDNSKGGFWGLGIDNSVKFCNEEDDVKNGLSGLGRDDSVKFRYAKDNVEGGYLGLEEGNSIKFCNVKDDAKGVFSGVGINDSMKFCHAKDDIKGGFSGLGIDNSIKFLYAKGDVKGRFSDSVIDNSDKFCNVKNDVKGVFSGSGIDNCIKFFNVEDDDKGGSSNLGRDDSVKFHPVKDDVKSGFSGFGIGDSVQFRNAKDKVKGGFSGLGIDNSVKIGHVEADVEKGLFSGFGVGNSIQIRRHMEENDVKASFSSCFGVVDNSVRIRYVRYYDKILVGMEVGRDDVKRIQDRLMDFLRDDLKMEVGSSVTHLGAGKVKFLGTVLQGVPFPKLPKSSKEMEMRKRVKHRIKQAATQRRAAIHNRVECLGKSILAQQLKKGKKETGSIEKAGILLADAFKAAGVTAQTDILKETAKAVQQNSRDILRSLGWSHMPPDVQQAFSRLDDSLGAWMSSIDTHVKPQKTQKSWNAWDRNGPISEYSIKIFAPLHEIVQRLRDRGLLTEKKVLPTHLARLSTRPDEDIVNWYSSVAYGLLAYYRCCDNFDKVRSLVDYHLRWSAIYTLARKHKCSAHQIIQKHSKDLRVFDGEAQILAEYPNTFELRMLRREFLDTACFNMVNMGKILSQELIRYSRSRK